MTDLTKAPMRPGRRPVRPHFSSGPCVKRPGWTVDVLSDAALGRSHRAKVGKTKLKQAIDQTKILMGLPDGYRVGIVPASDTGAVELALWSMLGARGVDILAWESFGSGWANDVVKQLKLDDVRVLESEYGALPDLGQVDWTRDVVFAWNGTTSGVRVPDGDWIAADREGLSICDATSAAFAQNIDWTKIDVGTFSWQKVLGGEAAHGVLVLGPRAVERLESYTPPWPLPKIFRLTKGGKLIEGIFEGATINTPSMLCVEDYLDALNWANSIGGAKGLQKRANANLKVLSDWVDRTEWIDFLAVDPATRSNTSVCLKVVAQWFEELSQIEQAAIAKQMAAVLENAGVAFDVGGYRDAPPGLRIWAGSTVETSDLETLTDWLDWAYEVVKSETVVG